MNENIVEGDIQEALTPAPKIQSKPSTMSFPDGMKEILKGNKIARVSWGNTDYCLLREGWLTIYTKGDFHTWTINDGDMEGEDWTIVGGIN